MGNSAISPLVERIENSEIPNGRYSVVIAGSTGACGQAFVSQHLEDPNCVQVIALTRNPVDSFGASFHETFLKKLIIEQVDFGNLQESGVIDDSIPRPIHAVCALGSAPFSELSDFTLPCKFADYCKTKEIKTMTLVSASGCKAGSIFGYLDTIGRREDYFISKKFEKLITLRPKLLLRGELARKKESFFTCITPSSQQIRVEDLARAAVSDAHRDLVDDILILEHSDMLAISNF